MNAAPSYHRRASDRPTESGFLAVRGWKVVVYASLLVGSGLVPARAEEFALRDQLQTLTRSQAIRVSGLERVSGEAVSLHSEGTPIAQLLELLSRYDYVLIHGGNGGAVALYIIGPHTPPIVSPPERSIKMYRVDSNYFVDAVLHVSERQSFRLRMLVDPALTGVMLPDALRGMLRLSDSELIDTEVVVGDEIVTARQATLEAISVEDIIAEDVVVLFVPDGALARSAALGRSLLQRLHLDVDDINGRLVVVEPRPQTRRPGHAR